MRNRNYRTYDYLLGSFLLTGALLLSELAQADPVTFTSNTIIDVSDTTYDGADIVVQGCTVTINGAHSFNSVQVLQSGVIRHQAATASQSFRCD